jgi:hypothetical protein
VSYREEKILTNEQAVQLFQLVKDTHELHESLWHPIPYQLKHVMRRARRLIAQIEDFTPAPDCTPSAPPRSSPDHP